MDLKKYVPIIVLLSGCTTTAVMSSRDIDNMKIDCSRKTEQLAFLRSQYPSADEQSTNGLIFTSAIGYTSALFNGSFNQHQEMYDGTYTSTVRMAIRNIESQCP